MMILKTFMKACLYYAFFVDSKYINKDEPTDEFSMLEIGTGLNKFELGLNLDGAIDRIQDKLNKQKMQQLLSVRGSENEIPGLKDILKDDDVSRQGINAVRATAPLVSNSDEEKWSPSIPVLSQPRLKQKLNESEKLNDRIQSLVERENKIENDVTTIKETLKELLETERNNQESVKNTLKDSIIKEVLDSISSSQKEINSYAPRFRQRQFNSGSKFHNNNQYTESDKEEQLIKTLQQTINTLKTKNISLNTDSKVYDDDDYTF